MCLTNARWYENAINAQDQEIQTLRDQVQDLEKQVTYWRTIAETVLRLEKLADREAVA